MLLRREVLAGIERGAITLAFRRWTRPTVRAGGTLKTAIGVLRIVAVDRVSERRITAADARRAGYASRRALLDELARRPGGELYRIELGFAGPDPRIALRGRRLDRTQWAELAATLARLDHRAGPGTDGPWVERTLAAIEKEPGVRAADLTPSLGVARDLLKRRVRRLKEHGLTESLETGYRLSARGRDALKRLRAAR